MPEVTQQDDFYLGSVTFELPLGQVIEGDPGGSWANTWSQERRLREDRDLGVISAQLLLEEPK